MSPSLHTLWQAGALDSDARISTGVVLGDAALHGFVGELPPLWLTDVTQTHGPAALAALAEPTRFVAINAAVEVDLFGQVNAGPRPGPDRHCRAPTPGQPGQCLVRHPAHAVTPALARGFQGVVRDGTYVYHVDPHG